MKPRVTRSASGMRWVCRSDDGAIGVGKTLVNAYYAWKRKRVKLALQRLLDVDESFQQWKSSEALRHMRLDEAYMRWQDTIPQDHHSRVAQEFYRANGYWLTGHDLKEETRKHQSAGRFLRMWWIPPTVEATH